MMLGRCGDAGDLSDEDEREKQQTFHFGVGGWWSLGILIHSGGPQGRGGQARGPSLPGRFNLGFRISEWGFGMGLTRWPGGDWEGR